MKDMVIIRTSGFKEMKRKRHLLYKLREVYAMFWEEHGNNVGFSTFCNLRLVNALLSRTTPHDMCLCEMRISLVWPTLYCHHTKGSGLVRMQFVDLRKEASSINVKLAKTAQS